MEYIQTILFQIPATRLEQAMQPEGLLAELDEHRNHLRNQPGFQDLRITRSINHEGNVLVLVETRWSDDNSLVRYETSEPNAAGIVRKHQSILVVDSLQVLDMEALRTESSFRAMEEAREASARLTLPIVIPLGVLAFALLAIYGLSRIYLEIGGDGAVALAAGIAIGVLLVAFYLANNPRVQGWQIGGLILVTTALLAGGTIWAVANEDEGEAEEQVEEPGGEEPGGEEPGGPGESPGPGGAEMVLVMDDNFFEYEGERNPDITVASGAEFSVPNQGNAIHNVHVATGGEYGDCGDDVCSDPDTVRAGQEATLVVELDPGEYEFRCDFHPDEMVGNFIVE
jgi:plastocyanin/heme-degrading monooxygenase HmoA